MFRPRAEGKAHKTPQELRTIVKNVQSHYKTQFGEDLDLSVIHCHLRAEILQQQFDFLQRTLGKAYATPELIDMVKEISDLIEESHKAVEPEKKGAVIEFRGVDAGKKEKKKPVESPRRDA